MGIKLTNNAFGTLAAGINSSATSITLTTGQGARFPTLSAGDYFYATLIDTSNNLEIVKCTARSTDVLTITRAQENTTARSYSTGDRIEIRLTAQTFLDASAPIEGDKGDITVSSAGTVWTIDNGVVNADKLASNAVTTAKILDSNVTASKLAVGAAADRFQYARLAVTGNISANTWYTLCDTGVLGGQGIGHLSGYSSTVGYGGDHYDMILDGGSLPLKDRTTNDAYTTSSYDFAKMAGHAPNAQRYYWRIRHQGGNPRSALIEWQSTAAMSGLTDGVLVFYIHAIVRL